MKMVLGPAQDLDLAYIRGKNERARGITRISPFYEEKRIVGGRSVDVTGLLDACWYAGYDGHPMPDVEPQRV